MKTKVSPAVVGLFVLGALMLGIGALLVFGGVNFFSQPQRFIVYFNESIHGLDLGSPVKLRGVRVGRVVDLNVRYDEWSNGSVVAVICEFSRNTITDAKGGLVDVSDRGEFQHLIDKGLRAQLWVQSLATGMLFVELDFLDPKAYPADLKITEVKYAVVPAVPSAISEFQANLTEILNNVRTVDFSGIGREMKQLLVDTRRQLEGLDLKAVATQWQKTGASLESLAEAPEIRNTFLNLNGAVTQLRGTLGKLDATLAANGPQLEETLVQAQQTLEAFDLAATHTRKFIAAQSGLGEETTRAMRQLTEAADAVQRLADFLERNPQALISGKKRPE